MPRYFIEVSYRGTLFSGFQVQQNAITIQSEVEKALQILFKQSFALTGASRTDSGVHALQNYFHVDVEQPLSRKNASHQPEDHDTQEKELNRATYNLNAILPPDIVIKRIFQVDNDAHCRFDAVSRAYKYYIYQSKNPFLNDRAYYFPYHLDMEKMNEAADILLQHKDFTSFSKRNTQVNNFNCDIKKSEWLVEKDTLIYHVEANRFLRGMVKGLTGTMLRVGMQKISINQFIDIINSRDCSKADFSVPAHALFLMSVSYKSF